MPSTANAAGKCPRSMEAWRPKLMDDEEARQTADQADIEGPLTDWKTKGHRVILVGKESLTGREVYKLEVTLRSGRVLHQYLDAATFLPVRSETTRLVRGRSNPGRDHVRRLPRRRWRLLSACHRDRSPRTSAAAESGGRGDRGEPFSRRHALRDAGPRALRN